MTDSKDMRVLGDDKWLNDIMGVTNDIVTKLMQGIFENVSSMLHNGVAYTIIMICIMLWLLNILKNGYPTRGEIFNAGKWLITVAFVLGIFSSYEAYDSFIGLLMIPAQWVRGAVGAIFDSTGGGYGFAEIVSNAVNKISTLGSFLWEYGMKEHQAWYKPDLVPVLFVTFRCLFYGIYWLAFMICVFGCVAIIFISTFMASLLLCGCAIVLPFLTIATMKQYFFSWLKLFISYTLYAPLGLIVLSLAITPINKLTELISAGKIEQIYNNQISSFFVPTIICMISIYLLKQIPDWVQQLTGASGGAMGTGAGGDFAGNVGKTATAGAVGSATAYTLARSQGAGGVSAIGKSILGGLSQAGKSLPFGKSGGKIANASWQATKDMKAPVMDKVNSVRNAINQSIIATP